jgi:hypothetical protein
LALKTGLGITEIKQKATVDAIQDTCKTTVTTNKIKKVHVLRGISPNTLWV